MATLPGLDKGVFQDPAPPAVDFVLSPITIPNGTTLVTTKTTNETITNVDELIDYVSGDNGPNFIPQLAIDSLVTDLAARELTANKGAVNGYAGLDDSQELLLANFPSGAALQVLRRNAGNTALEFADPASAGIASINGDTTAAQIIAAGAGLDLLDAGDTHTLFIGDNNVTLGMMATIPETTFLGRESDGFGNVEVVTPTQATSFLDLFTDTVKGLVPLSGGGTVNFLRADGTFAPPPGEANTISSQGGGAIELTASIPKSGVDLRVISIDAGDGINASLSLDLLTLSVESTVVQTNQVNTYSGAFDQDFVGSALRNVNFFESDAPFPATSNTIRFGTGEGFAWRNNANTDNEILSFNPFGDDILCFQTSSTITRTGFDLINSAPALVDQVIGSYGFFGQPGIQPYAFLSVETPNVTGGIEEGALTLVVREAGSTTDYMSLNAGGLNVIDFFKDLQTNNNDILLGTGQITVTGGILGDLYKHDGIGFSAFPRGTNPGQFLRVNSANTDLEYVDDIITINFLFDNGGAVLIPGIAGEIVVDFDCEVIEWAIVKKNGTPDGAIVVDILRSTFAGFPAALSIAGTELPTIVATSSKGDDRDITTWSTINAGDVLDFSIVSVTAIEGCTVALKCRKI